MKKHLLPAAIVASLLACAIGAASFVRGARDFYAHANADGGTVVEQPGNARRCVHDCRLGD
jgi:hypothetical protein